MNPYQHALLVLEAACAAYARRLAEHVVDNSDAISQQAIGGETSFATDQLVELTERLREHSQALAGLYDWQHVWAPRGIVVVTADRSGVVREERE